MTIDKWHLSIIQEIIDMCDYAVGLSRQLNGSIIPSERKFNYLVMDMQK
jgi:aldehyde dehydrogenase family 7 member A1